MVYRLVGAFLLPLLAVASCASGPSHQMRWQRFRARVPFAQPALRAHLDMDTRVPVGGQLHDFAVVRLAPDARIVAAHACRDEERASAEDWAKRFAAPALVFNAGFYDHDGTHLGWLKTEGLWQTKARHPHWQGLFVAGPTESFLPAWQVLDLQDFESPDAAETLVEHYDTVVQTMVLRDERGRFRGNRSAQKAARTVLARDAAGRLVVLFSERAVSLSELSEALPQFATPIALALNLDGGLESQLAIRDEDGNTMMLTSRDGSRHSVPDAWTSHMAVRPLPSVLAVVP